MDTPATHATPTPVLPPADRLGIFASLVCLVHCAAFPVLALTVPALGTAWIAGEWLGWAGITVASAVAVVTLPAGRTQHGHAGPMVLAAAGMLLLVSGEVVGSTSMASGAFLSLLGATGLITAHFQNRRLARNCRVCGHAECASPIGGEPSPR